jgi:hypothetical protein
MYPESLVVLVLFCDVVFRFLILPPGTESTYQVESLKDASLLLHASLSLLLNLLRTSSHTSSGVVQLYKNPGDGSRRQRDKRTLAEQIQAVQLANLSPVLARTWSTTSRRRRLRTGPWAVLATGASDFVEQGGQELVHYLQQSEVKTQGCQGVCFNLVLPEGQQTVDGL